MVNKVAPLSPKKNLKYVHWKYIRKDDQIFLKVNNLIFTNGGRVLNVTTVSYTHLTLPTKA